MASLKQSVIKTTLEFGHDNFKCRLVFTGQTGRLPGKPSKAVVTFLKSILCSPSVSAKNIGDMRATHEELQVSAGLSYGSVADTVE